MSKFNAEIQVEETFNDIAEQEFREAVNADLNDDNEVKNEKPSEIAMKNNL